RSVGVVHVSVGAAILGVEVADSTHGRSGPGRWIGAGEAAGAGHGAADHVALSRGCRGLAGAVLVARRRHHEAAIPSDAERRVLGIELMVARHPVGATAVAGDVTG